MTLDFSNTKSLEAAIGKPLGKSRWFEITQEQISAFGQVTQDLDSMHMDPDWARDHSPFGQTIAYGFQTLSMMSAMMNDIFPKGASEAYKLNYGFDRVRFMSPVKEGARIRGNATLKNVRPRPDGATIVTIEIVVEIEGEEKPALVAAWLFMVANALSKER